MRNQPLPEIALRSLSKTAGVMLLLACAAGWGSCSSDTTGVAGPNDAGASTGGSGGAGGAKSSTGGSGGAGGAKSSTGGSGGAGGAQSSTGGSGGTGGAQSSTGGSGGVGGAKSSTGGSGGAGGAKSSTGGSGGAGGAKSSTGGSGGAGGVPTGSAQAVNLRTSGNYVILAESGISTVPPAVVTGNVGISPMTATSITGFSLIADATTVFFTSTQVIGKVYAADNTGSTSSDLTTAIGDMGLAFTDAAGRAPDVTELGAGSIGGMTLAPGVYKWGTAVLIPSDLTLNGSATSVWIFQIAQNLTVSSAVTIHLTGGALAKNVFWQVAGFVELATTSHVEGIVLCQTMINLRTGASIEGRLMAQTAVNLEASTVTQPAP